MTSEGLGMGEVFEGDPANSCGKKFTLVSMGGRANGQACADEVPDQTSKDGGGQQHL
jgi:hypothetical protein